MNAEFGRVSGGVMTQAPNGIEVEGGFMINPTADDYAKCVPPYLPNEYTKPSPEPGFHVSSVRWATDGRRNFRVYEYEKDAPVTHRYSKLLIESALFKTGLLEKLDEFVDSQFVENEFGQKMPLRRMYETANEFADDNPFFGKFIGVAKDALGLDDKTLEILLASCLIK